MNDIIYAGNIACGEPRKAYEIALASQSGEVIWESGKKSYAAGQIIVIPPFLHCERAAGAHDIYVQIERAALSLKSPEVFSDDENRGLAHAIRQAAAYFGEEKKREGILHALGGLLAGYIADFRERSGLSPVVERVKKEIENNLRDPSFSLEDSLKKLPLNYDYVRKLFRKEVGVTPHEYLVSARMDFARGLMDSGITNRYSAFSVSQIAESCGFSEPLYFSRVFKKYFGVSPSEYAKK